MGAILRTHERPTLHPLLPHRRHPGHPRVAGICRRPGVIRRLPGIRAPPLRGPRPGRRPQRGGHRAGSHPAGDGAARVGGLLPQQGTARNEDIPDHLLFADAGSKERASAEPNAAARARHAAVVEESKASACHWTRATGRAGFQTGPPTARSSATWHRRGRFGEPGPLGPAHQRPRLALVLLSRPAPGGGYLAADLAHLLEAGREEDLRVFHLKTARPTPGLSKTGSRRRTRILRWRGARRGRERLCRPWPAITRSNAPRST